MTPKDRTQKIVQVHIAVSVAFVMAYLFVTNGEYVDMFERGVAVFLFVVCHLFTALISHESIE